MMSEESFLTREKAFYGLIFVLALAMRLIGLGDAPLGEGEATLAMQALEQSRGLAPVLSAQPGYLQLTTLLFYVLGAGPVLARLWPALMGSLLVWAPFFLRKPFGRIPALLFAFLIAFDPGMIALSRQADGQILALSGLLLAIGLWVARRPAWSGVFLALGLLGGPQVWPGLIALGVAWVIARPDEVEGLTFEHGLLRKMLFWAGGTLLVLGSLLLLAPRGLSAFAQSLVDYGRGWFTWPVSTTAWPNWQEAKPIGRLLLALVVYHPWGLIIGLVVGVRSIGRRGSMNRFLFVWWGIALLLALAYPGRQVTDLGWSLLPMLLVVARQLVLWVNVEREDVLPALMLAVMSFVLTVFVWMRLLMYLTASVDVLSFVSSQATLHLAALATALGMIVVLGLLVGVGWNGRAAKLGLLGGLGGALLLYSFGVGLGAGGLRGQQPELWRQEPVFSDADLMVKSLVQVSQWTTRENYAVDGVVAGVPSESLRWALRDFRNIRFERVLPPLNTENPPTVLITMEQEELAASTQYTGQPFTIAAYVPWDLMLTKEFGFWITLRRAPVQEPIVILWVRSDRFPGSSQN
jgi:hypothetical protein